MKELTKREFVALEILKARTMRPIKMKGPRDHTEQVEIALKMADVLLRDEKEKK